VVTEGFMQRMLRSSHLGGQNAAYIEALYEDYLQDPKAIPEVWRSYFDTLPTVESTIGPDTPHSQVIQHFERLGRNRLKARPEKVSTEISSAHETRQMCVQDLVAAYRHRGHKRANIDPLGMMERPSMPVLDLAYHNLSPASLEEIFQTGTFHYGDGAAKLRDLVDALESTYCGSIGAEYMHIVDTREQLWVQQRLESTRGKPQFDGEQKQRILERLIAAEGLEKYLHRRYPGTKRFGLEGGESLIPMLHELLQRLGTHGVRESVIAMAHRGRLNVLVNVLGKNPGELFDEFDGRVQSENGSGDVKYHQGFSSNVMTPGGEMHLALSFNPSHLEIVAPVAEGSVRARQDRRKDYSGDLVAPIIIHGDAAFAGQGVVMETFQMSQTRGFKTGGSVHIIINNQIGFTTHKQIDARSTEYCTEVAKMIQAPILHVNGDDPEAVIFATQLAADYRMEFRKDVVIDLICYRRRGHNEAEEPMKTQPLMYQKIRGQNTVCALFGEKIIQAGVMQADAVEAMTERYRTRLEDGESVALDLVHEPDSKLFVDWNPYLGSSLDTPADTTFDSAAFQELSSRLEAVPDGFVLHRQVSKIIEDRHRMAAGAMPINWGMAEVMAYATLVQQGYPVRLTGQDVGVGTFSHRHAALHNQKDGSRLIPLNLLREDVTFDLYDSLLSEEAVLAFEYGYATTAPNTLVVWEAQFGDFVNGAQVVIDQFISSGETKWARLCGLTMLLPHGFEGAGPEHSSARLERFLQLCAEHNMQICVPSTPAQVYHMLRRQAIRPTRKPLIAMTPKSLLRHKLAVSTVDELCHGHFQRVIGETEDLQASKVKRVVLCSGKVYFDLWEARAEQGLIDVAIVRIEQLYPFPDEELQQELSKYAKTEHVIWCQEEPINQGAWFSIQYRIRRVMARLSKKPTLHYAGRDAFAAPAVGYASVHIEQQQGLVKSALTGDPSDDMENGH
jgi:2-oxoglutarate dehydrogenase E1 component